MKYQRELLLSFYASYDDFVQVMTILLRREIKLYTITMQWQTMQKTSQK